MRTALQEAGIACELSSSAGHFVCNHVFYALMHHLQKRRAPQSVLGGFIHVPYLPEQAAASGAPSMPLHQVILGLQVAIAAIFASNSS